jgi:hypothetical protein
MGITKWMRMHELHRNVQVKSMAQVRHPGELILVAAITAARLQGSADAAVVAQPFFSVFRGRHDHAKARDDLARDITAIDRILPDRQPRA